MVGNSFIGALVSTLDMLLVLYSYVLLARVLISWVGADPYNPVVRFLISSTEPILGPLRQAIPPISGIDISPLVVFFLIHFLRELLYAWAFQARMG